MTREDPLWELRRSRPVDPAFADRLEASLRVQHASRHAQPARPSPWRRLVLAAPVLVLVVAVASAVLILRDDNPSAALELTEAHNVTVTLIDGTSLVDPDGLELADGTVITVGLDGRAVIGDIELGPGSVVIVRDGELVTADPATTTSTAPTDETAASSAPRTSPPSETRPAASTRPPPVDQPPDREDQPVDPPRTTVPTDSDADHEGRADDAPSTTRPPDAEDTDPDPEPEPTQPPAPDRVVDLALTVRHRDGGVAIGWRATGSNLGGLRVLLVRSRGPDAPDPDWPLTAAGMTVVGETTGSEPGGFVDEQPPPDSVVRYRAIALHGDEVVARSAVQTLATDG